MKFVSKLLLAAVTALGLVGCGGGGGGDGASQSAVVAAGTPVAINASTGAAIATALQGATFNFASAPPEFGISTGFTLGIGASTSGSPTFAINAPGGKATGDLGFGSCIFTITDSTFAVGHPLVKGAKITIKDCSIELADAVNANGNSQQAGTKIGLGGVKSTNTATITIAVSATGTLTLFTPTGQSIVLPVTVKPGTVTGSVGVTGSVSQ